MPENDDVSRAVPDAGHEGEQEAEQEAERWPNLVELFFARAAEHGAAPFLWQKTGEAWCAIRWDEAAKRVAGIATALRARGLRPGERVVLVSENRPEFCLFDLGIMAAGGVSVPTYTTNTVRDHQHILENSGAVAAIVSTAKLARPLLEAAMRSSHCRLLVSFERMAHGQAPASLELLHVDELLAGVVADVAAVRAAVTSGRDDLACLIYTSGTGGAPRGVCQHHGAILRNIAGCAEILHDDFPPTAGPERFLSFLPLSHAYEHTAGQYLPIGLGGQIYYAESLEKLATNIRETAPTIMVVVPRLFELLRTRMLKEIERKGGLAPKLLGAAGRLQEKRAAGQRLGLADRSLDFLLERTLRNNVRGALGGRLKAMVSGGAPLNPEVGRFFDAVGVTVLQGYGQTEAGPVISCNRPRAGIRMDSVGPPLPGVGVKIADDGEILVAGELVMHGYWRNPAESARVLGEDGWLRTGDIGRLDPDGHLVITDRKKDIIVNDKGDNVAPQRIEGMLTLQPEIAQAMVYGDRRPYLVGVVVPDNDYLLHWAAKEGQDIEAIRQEPDFLRSMQAAVDRVNAHLSVTEKVRRVILADAPFSIENEQLTPSLKIRRHVLKEIYGARLDSLYR